MYIIAGLSLKSQELTAMFLAVRLYCSFVMEYDIHTLLDLATLATTLWVIYMIRFNLRSSYMEDKDNFLIYYVVSHKQHMYTFFQFSSWVVLSWASFSFGIFISKKYLVMLIVCICMCAHGYYICVMRLIWVIWTSEVIYWYKGLLIDLSNSKVLSVLCTTNGIMLWSRPLQCYFQILIWCPFTVWYIYFFA